MDTNQTAERTIRIEQDVKHISEKVDTIEERQQAHEGSTRQAFEALRENALRQQIATENLVKAVEGISNSNAVRLKAVEERQDKVDIRLLDVEKKWDFSLLMGKGVITIVTTPALLLIVWQVANWLRSA